MSASDAIVVGEGWISEHYFTTDATSQSFHAKVLERRKAYDEEAAQGRATARSRFTEARQRIEVELGSIAEVADPIAAQEVADGVHERILAVLGLGEHGLRTQRQGRVLRVSAPGIGTGAPLAIVLATSVDTIEDLLAKEAATLPEPVTLGEDAAYTSAARLVSALFVQDDAPQLVLVLAGRWILLAERERWAEGRYLAVDVQLVCERNDTRRGGEIDRMLACLAAESIAPDADGDLWWSAVLEESVKHTVGVSQDLRDGVRLSIEILANEVVARRRDQGREPLRPDQAQPLAKQALRFLYRILFLLYAEASPSSACCRSARRSTPRATAWTGCASWSRWSSRPQEPDPARIYMSPSTCSSGSSTRVTGPRQRRAPTASPSTRCGPTCSDRQPPR